jgi:tRNA G10  N-methylase Trm11
MGGIIKIGKVVTNVATWTVGEAFLEESKQAQAQVRMSLSASGIADEMVEAASGKSVFGVSVYCAERSFHPVSRTMQRFVGSTLKHELAAHGRKSGFMGFPRSRQQPQLSHVEVLRKGLVERRAEVLFCIGKKQTVVATTVGVHDPFEFQKRDIGRPVQRKIFAIPPRLARIMINLASCTDGKSLLDPFCGVGTILQEALLAKGRVIGVDVNPWCVEASRENLEWLKKEYALEEAEYTVLLGDSRRLEKRIRQEVDCIATEPDLGPALRHVATTPYATKIIDKLRPLYFDFLAEAYGRLKKGGRLVLVTPYIRTRSGKPVTMRIEEKAVTVGFKRVHPFPKEVLPRGNTARENLMEMTCLVDVGERHKIGREIHVFQK